MIRKNSSKYIGLIPSAYFFVLATWAIIHELITGFVRVPVIICSLPFLLPFIFRNKYVWIICGVTLFLTCLLSTFVLLNYYVTIPDMPLYASVLVMLFLLFSLALAIILGYQGYKKLSSSI